MHRYPRSYVCHFPHFSHFCHFSHSRSYPLPPLLSRLLSLSTLFSSPLRGGTCKKYSCKRLVQLYRRKYCASFQFFKISTAPCTVRMLPLPVHTSARPHMDAHADSRGRCPLTRICLADGLCGGCWRPCKSTSSRSLARPPRAADRLVVSALRCQWLCRAAGAKTRAATAACAGHRGRWHMAGQPESRCKSVRWSARFNGCLCQSVRPCVCAVGVPLHVCCSW